MVRNGYNMFRAPAQDQGYDLELVICYMNCMWYRAQ